MSNGVGLVTLLAVLPLVGSVVVALLPSSRPTLAKQVALAFAVATLLLGVGVALGFDTGEGAFQMVESQSWIPALGISWTVGLDGIGLILVLLAVILVPVVMVAGWNELDDYTARTSAAARASGRVPAAAGAAVTGGVSTGSAAASRPHGGSVPGGLPAGSAAGSDGGNGSAAAEAPPLGSVKGYLALMLVTEAFMIGVFTALDVFVFYVFFEAILIPVYLMIGRYGTAHRTYAAVKFLIYSLVGGLIMLASLVGLWALSADEPGGPTMDLTALTQLEISPTIQNFLFAGFFIAFAVKAPMWPVHTWLPDAAGASQPTTAVLLIGVLDKIGTFGMLRLCLPLFPDAAQTFAPYIIAAAVVSIFYGGMVAIGQTDMKRMFGYISVSHFGFIVLGIFVLTSQGMSGSTVYMLGHGLSTALLFLVAGYLIARRGSSRVEDYGGVNKVAPLAAGSFLIAGLTAIALPGMLTFLGEFLVLLGTFARYPWVGVVATLGIVLAAVYVLVLYQRTMTGPPSEGVKGMKDLNVREMAAIAPVIALVIFLGFYAKPLFDVINPTVDVTMEQVGVTDPEPAVAVETDEEFQP